ncbi:MAG: DUF499 domain-containing protein [Sphaerochaetaceae bacterium]|nr:DUF499 domain-containing protein [Sphaerochaetaceae bacterium]
MLRPWREVISPHKDVAGGKYQQAEFAADLAQVLSGKAEKEYQDATEFFNRTYLTEGMRLLLISVIKRTTQIDGEPVVQLKTAFGGGKTHTMLALYHLFKDKKSENHPTIKKLLQDIKIKKLPDVKIAVLVGTDIDPAKPKVIPGAKYKINTLWGYMAYQIGGEKAFNQIKESDQKRVAPGADTLVNLFDEFGPCVILIDELIAYARNIYGKNDLSSGSFESLMTFIQNLTEATKRSKNSTVIASIPASNIEIGGEGGSAALIRIENTFGRLEAIWKPVKASESFEIVRRRLFDAQYDEKLKNEVCEAFSKMYSKESNDFPAECKEINYLDRLIEAYPIHPDFFDRLYSDWSTLEKFQRTRGVLRLMATTIHQLWINGDKSLLIMPGNLPLDSPKVRDELTRYLGDEWNGIVDTDIDGDRSEPKRLDQTNNRFGSLTAGRRVARTIFLGSAPSAKEQKNRGIEDVRIILGVAQPEESIATYRDALSTLSQKSTYLYYQGNRYWYDSHPNLRKTVEDRASRIDDEEAFAEITKRLSTIKDKGDFSGIHICAENEDIPDDDETRLIVLSPGNAHVKDSSLSQALIKSKDILDTRGHIPRQYKNMLIFIAPDNEGIRALYQDTKRFLAWKSVADEKDILNLDAHQRRQSEESLNLINKTVDIRLSEAYIWLIIPTQEGTSPINLEAKKITKGEGNFILRASKQLKNDELLITQWSPALLNNELDKWLWKDKKHISTKQLWAFLASYPYLPRLKNSEVLIDAIKEGIRSKDFFAFATNIDKSGKYLGLEFGNPGANVNIDDLSLLIKKEVANQQQITEQRKEFDQNKQNNMPHTEQHQQRSEKEIIEEAKKQSLTRFYGTTELNSMRLSRDAGQIAEEIIQHLASLQSSEINITLEIKANVPDGIPEKTIRILLENCKTLKFKINEFEE